MPSKKEKESTVTPIKTIQLPSMGREVEYTCSASAPREGGPAGTKWPATILRVKEPNNPESDVTLFVKTELGSFTAQDAPYAKPDADGKIDPNGCWNWLPYVQPLIVEETPSEDEKPADGE